MKKDRKKAVDAVGKFAKQHVQTTAAKIDVKETWNTSKRNGC